MKVGEDFGHAKAQTSTLDIGHSRQGVPLLAKNKALLGAQANTTEKMAQHEQKPLARLPFVDVQAYDENEETTYIESALLLTESCIKQWLLVPLVSLFTILVFPVFLYWSKPMQSRWLYSRATSVDDATHLYVEGRDGNKEIVKLQNFEARSSPLLENAQRADPAIEGLSIFFTYRFINFEWRPLQNIFTAVRFNCELPYDELRRKYTDQNRIGNESLRELQSMKFGPCEVDVPKKSVFGILMSEVLNPFFIFQVFSVVLWMWDNYYYYASCILIISTGSVILSLYETINNHNEIRKMARYHCLVRLMGPNGTQTEVNSTQLVPGDVVVVPESTSLPCDLVLLTGTAITNEAMLTGESIPVMKSSLPNVASEIYSEKGAEKHTLFGGTIVIQTKPVGDEPVWGMVKNTGFLTTKGSLIRDILYPKEIKFKFYSDGFKFVGIMACLALVAMATTIPMQIELNVPVQICIDRTLDLLTVTVPPALPAAMTCGIVFAIGRLKKQDIFCISPPRINLAGQIKTFVFDKTGTLTEEGLTVLGFRPTAKGAQAEFEPAGGVSSPQRGESARSHFAPFTKDAKTLTPQSPAWWVAPDAEEVRNKHSTLMAEAMASCTAVTYVEGQLVGDPLDVQMFEANDWVFNENDQKMDGQDELVIGFVQPRQAQSAAPRMPSISEQSSADENQAGVNRKFRNALIRRFDFTSALQRMSVICKNDFDRGVYKAYVKGSPEKIAELCRPETLPRDYLKVLQEYTQEGYRVIAMSVKDLPQTNYRKIQTMDRAEVESNLTFLGLLIMENKMKDVTKGVIETLNECEVTTIMATGDNVLTAISVAGQCGIVNRDDQVFLGDLSYHDQTQEPFIIWQSQSLQKSIGTMNQMAATAMSSDNSNEDDEIQGNSPLPWDYQAQKISVALTGKAFKFAYERQEEEPFVFNSILAKAKVYARMSPEDKALLVTSLQNNLGVNCGMCGDGANDCGALKSAAVGISLSEAEASIAAPFTSKVQDIRCVVKLLIEGKAAMTTSFQAFKFIELYSVIQLVTCTLLYAIGSNITDTQFLFVDLVALVPLSVVQAWTGSYHKLTKDVPTATLFYCPVLTSVIVSSVIQLAFQVFFFLNIQQQPFYKPIDTSTLSFDSPNYSYEETVLFMVANFQYLVTCMAFSISKPFRRPIYTNWIFTACIIILFVLNVVFVFLPSDSSINTLFNLLAFKDEDGTDYYGYRYWIFLGIILNSSLTYVAEKLIVNVITRKADQRLQSKKEAAFHVQMRAYRAQLE